jgi:hypothetical protein
MVVAHWVEVLATKASASGSSGAGSSGTVLECSVTVPGTKGATLALTSAAGSFVVV